MVIVEAPRNGIDCRLSLLSNRPHPQTGTHSCTHHSGGYPCTSVSRLSWVVKGCQVWLFDPNFSPYYESLRYMTWGFSSNQEVG